VYKRSDELNNFYLLRSSDKLLLNICKGNLPHQKQILLSSVGPKNAPGQFLIGYAPFSKPRQNFYFVAGEFTLEQPAILILGITISKLFILNKRKELWKNILNHKFYVEPLQKNFGLN